MTRKDFVLIADVIATAKLMDGVPAHWNRSDIAHAFADRLASTNPNFDRARFIDACTKED